MEIEEWALVNTRTQTYLVPWSLDDAPVVDGFHAALRTTHPDEIRVLRRTLDVDDVTGQMPFIPIASD